MVWNPIHKHLEKDIYPASEDVEAFKKWARDHKITSVGIFNPDDKKSIFSGPGVDMFDHVRLYRSSNGTEYLTAHVYKDEFYDVMAESGLLSTISRWAEEKNLDVETIPSWYYPERCIGIIASTR